MSNKNVATINFDVGDSPISVILKVRDALELLNEHNAFLESLIVAQRNESDENFKKLRCDIAEIHKLLKPDGKQSHANDDEAKRHVEIHQPSPKIPTAQTNPISAQDQLEELSKMRICGPSCRSSDPPLESPRKPTTSAAPPANPTSVFARLPARQAAVKTFPPPIEPVVKETARQDAVKTFPPAIEPIAKESVFTKPEPVKPNGTSPIKPVAKEPIKTTEPLKPTQPPPIKPLIKESVSTKPEPAQSIEPKTSPLNKIVKESTAPAKNAEPEKPLTSTPSSQEPLNIPPNTTNTTEASTRRISKKALPPALARKYGNKDEQDTSDSESDDNLLHFTRNKQILPRPKQPKNASNDQPSASAEKKPQPDVVKSSPTVENEKVVDSSSTCEHCGLKDCCICLIEDSDDDFVSILRKKDEPTDRKRNESTDSNEQYDSALSDGEFLDQKTSSAEKSSRSTKSPTPTISAPASTSTAQNTTALPPQPTFGRPMFGKPMFGVPPKKTFDDFKTNAPSFLKKIPRSQNPFAIDPTTEHKIFAVPPQTNSAEKEVSDHPPTIPNPVPNQLTGLAPGVTGEEGEQIWFSARCNLYRFFNQPRETKVKGVGELKLLENPQTGKLRCVMRREQVHIVCANFNITKNFDIRTGNQAKRNVLTWNCRDFSDPSKPAGEFMTLICRFKDEDIANTFKKIVKEFSEN